MLGCKTDVYYQNNKMITASKYEFAENLIAENVNEQVKYFFHSNLRLLLPSHALWIWGKKKKRTLFISNA